MPPMPDQGIARYFAGEVLVHQVASWRSLGAREGVQLTTVCGFVKIKEYGEPPMWADTKTTDAVTCLWCIAHRDNYGYQYRELP
jgi:hypothetical protein